MLPVTTLILNARETGEGSVLFQFRTAVTWNESAARAEPIKSANTIKCREMSETL